MIRAIAIALTLLVVAGTACVPVGAWGVDENETSSPVADRLAG